MMTQQQYERISAPFRRPARQKMLIWLNRLITGCVYAAYILLCAILAVRLDLRLIPVVAIPAVPFVLLSFYRKTVNAPRPYEALNIVPLLKPHRQGKSFPSRHVFSAFVIATTLAGFWPPLGLVIAVLGALLMAIRVIGGIHFPRDVFAGTIIGIISGGIGLTVWHWIGGIL